MLVAAAIAFAAALLPVSVPLLGIRFAIASACVALSAGMMLTLAGRCAWPPMRRIAVWIMSTPLPSPT
jgi:hypothetical protein